MSAGKHLHRPSLFVAAWVPLLAWPYKISASITKTLVTDVLKEPQVAAGPSHHQQVHAWVSRLPPAAGWLHRPSEACLNLNNSCLAHTTFFAQPLPPGPDPGLPMSPSAHHTDQAGP